MTARKPGEEWKSVTIPVKTLVVCNNEHAYNAQDNPVCPSCGQAERFSVEGLLQEMQKLIDKVKKGFVYYPELDPSREKKKEPS